MAAGTIVRIRGYMSAYLTAYTSAGDGFHGAAGIGIVSKTAFDAGLASVPTPITEAAWDGWMWHRYFDIHGQLAAGSTAVGVTNNLNIEVDTKAMRKISDEMIVYAIYEVVEQGTAVIDVFFESRLLLKEG